GAKFWTTSVDDYWWAGDRFLPGAHSIAKMVAGASDTEDVEVLGKPSEHARRIVKEEWNLMPGNTILIGDNIESDMVLGNRLGFQTGLVLGGTSTEEDLNDAGPREKPKIVFREFERILMKI
ncbi:MAG: HAD hydrolase-like protein, partial [Candidatus Nanohaloarchaea archaeon]